MQTRGTQIRDLRPNCPVRNPNPSADRGIGRLHMISAAMYGRINRKFSLAARSSSSA